MLNRWFSYAGLRMEGVRRQIHMKYHPSDLARGHTLPPTLPTHPSMVRYLSYILAWGLG